MSTIKRSKRKTPKTFQVLTQALKRHMEEKTSFMAPAYAGSHEGSKRQGHDKEKRKARNKMAKASRRKNR
jgi:hypothetical protein